MAKKAWERQPGETSKAFGAFCIYRDIGPQRSMPQVLEIGNLSCKLNNLETWCTRYSWVARAAAYDDYLDSIKRKEKEKQIVEMSERHAKLAVAFQAKIAERLKNLEIAELSPKDMCHWLDVSTKLERISRGEPTEIQKQEVLIVDDI